MQKITTIQSQYTDDDGNTISSETIGNCKGITFYGNNNSLVIGQHVKIAHLQIDFLMDNAHVIIKEKSNVGLYIAIGESSRVEIGKNCSILYKMSIFTSEGGSVTIGDDALISNNVVIRACDGHPIYSVITKKRVNFTKNVSIGKHVWIGYEAVFMGGAEVATGSIVGYRALVTKKFPNNCVIGGSPAKILRRHAFWVRPHKARLGFTVNSQRAIDLCSHDYMSITREKLSRTQTMILLLYRAALFFHSKAEANVFKADPQMFFLQTQLHIAKYTSKLLNLSGPAIF